MSKAGVSAKWDNDFDPYGNRNIINGLTHVESLINFIKGCMGTGIFALPEAFYLVGMWNGIVGFIFTALFATYCFHVLIRSQYHLCKYMNVGLLTYPDSMKVAFEVGPGCLKGHTNFIWHFTNILFVSFQFGVMCVYVIFVSENIQSICNQYSEKSIPLYLIMLSILLPFACVVCIKNLKIFTPFSYLANVITLLTLAVLAYYVSKNLPKFNSRPAIGTEFKRYPLAFGTALFAIYSVPIVVSIENSMTDGKYFLATIGTLNVGFGIIALLYLIVGVMGYWKYGEDIKSSIIQNFPKEDLIAQIIQVLYSIALTLSYGLQGIIPVAVIWENYLLPKFQENEITEKKIVISNYCLRLGLCFLSFVTSMLIPFLGSIISLVGGVCMSIIGIIFPSLLEICALWPDGFGKFHWVFWKDVLLSFIGLFTAVACAYASVQDIAVQLSTHEITS